MAAFFALLFMAGLFTGIAWVLYAMFGAWGLVFGVILLILAAGINS